MKAISADGHELRARTLGDGPLPVLFVHGWMVSGAVWDELLAALPPTRHRFIVPDLRGTGGSARPVEGYRLEQYCADLLAIADASGAQRFTIVGHAMGGQLAQMLAARHPERVAGVVGLSPVPASGIPLPDEVIALFSSCAADRDKQTAILGAASKALPEATRERLLDDGVQTSDAAIRGALHAFRVGGFASELSSIHAPTLCVSTEDPFLPRDFLQASVAAPIASASLVHLPGAGHYLMNERPGECAAIVGAFLAGLPAGLYV